MSHKMTGNLFFLAIGDLAASLINPASTTAALLYSLNAGNVAIA